MYKVSQYKRLLSYLYPVSLWKGSSAHNPALELLLYHGHYQLATADAVYSDGKDYRPMVLAFDELKKVLPEVSTVLVLGTGLGSAVEIITGKGYHPQYTLVDIDEVILSLTKTILPAAEHITYHCADALEFVQDHTLHYDVIVIDIFRNRDVPDAFTQTAFFRQCSNMLTSSGYVVFNYIVNDKAEWQRVEANIRAVFTYVKILQEGINNIVIAKA